MSGNKGQMQSEKDAIIRLLQDRPSVASDLAEKVGLASDTITAILKSDRHAFKHTGLWLIGESAEPEWTLTKIFDAELFGRKTIPRVR